jgi:hypothetical protein
VQATLRKMRADLCDTKLILGVDRLDCIKGIPHKLHAFDRLLERRPDLIGQAVLLQIAIPSRDDLKSHQDLKEEIQHLVGKINGKYGRYLSLSTFPTRLNTTNLTNPRRQSKLRPCAIPLHLHRPRRTHGPLRRSRRLLRLEHARRHESSLLRIRRLPQ